MSSNPIILSDDLTLDWQLDNQRVGNVEQKVVTDVDLPAGITKAASKQTYYTIRFLVDRDRVPDAYRTYAYFRWLDDCLDEALSNQSERLAFVKHQQNIMNRCYQRESLSDLSREEQMLVDLIHSDLQPDSGLQSYIRHMMAVMAFDADRRGRLISYQELNDYTQNLAIAVTEALHYFIGHGQFAPHNEDRYCAATGAHILHMLRDTYDDIGAGYFNVPREFLDAHHIDITYVDSEAYRIWAKSRVGQAKACFQAGNAYLMRVESRRCRIAGYSYMARFQGVLNTLSKENYRLRLAYQGRKSLSGGLSMAMALISTIVTGRI